MSAAVAMPPPVVVAIDGETGLIQGGMLAPPLACITLCRDPNTDGEIYHWRDPECERQVEQLLTEGQLTTANGAYDLGVIASQYPHLTPLVFQALMDRRVHDVLIRQKLVDISEGSYRLKEVEEGVWVSVRYGLSDLHNRHCGSHLEKDKWRLQYGKLRNLPLEQWDPGAIFYAKNDAVATLKVHYAQDAYKPKFAKISTVLRNEPDQVYAAYALHMISCWGMRTDPLWVAKMLQKIQQEQIQRRDQLIKAGLVREWEETRAMNVAKARMREVMGDKCELTDTGLDRYRDWWVQMKKLGKLEGPQGAALKMAEKRRLFEQGYIKLGGEIANRSGDPILIAFAAYGQFQTLYTKICKLQTNRLPIQTSFEVLLETGRTSSFANKLIPNSVAMQNLPRQEGMRECFVPRCYNHEDIHQRKVFVAVDYAMAELVSLAQVCFKKFKASKLREALNAGQDPHLLLAAKILKISYEEAKLRLKNNDPVLIDARQKAKPVSFGFPGGLGIEKFIEYARVSYGAIFTEETAQLYKNMWFELYPEMRQYFEWISGLVDAGGGRCNIQQLYSGRVRGNIPYTVACNSLFQGLTADGMKAAMCEAVRRCYTPVWVDEKFNEVSREVGQLSYLYGSRIVNEVHDELVGETPELNGHNFAVELSAVMEMKYQPYTPNVTIRTEAAMMRRWRKGAKPVTHNGKPLHEGGILLPYEDGMPLVKSIGAARKAGDEAGALRFEAELAQLAFRRAA
jgi:hypothetical protein